MASVNAFLHLVNVATYVFTTYYALFILHVPLFQEHFEKFDPGLLKFLTIWCLIVQTVFFLICLLNDLLGSNAVNPKQRPFLRKLKDFVHASLGFPLAMFVGITFWSLMFVDRELVMPKAVDPYFPWWLNHLMHTMIMVSTVLEMIVAPRQYPKRSHALGALITFVLAYLVWVHLIYYKTGQWVYPIMNVLSAPLRVVFFLVLFVFMIMIYFAGESFNNLVWGNETTKRKKSHSKSK